MDKSVVIATSTYYKINDIRSQLAAKTVQEAVARNIQIVVVDGGSYTGFLKDVSSQNLHVLPQERPGMGSGRRQAMLAAANLTGSNGVVIWMEPEKWPLLDSIEAITEPILEGHVDLVIPERRSLWSYPKEQEHAELLGNLAFSYMTNRKYDVWFGPRVFNKNALSRFLEYDGRYGDNWDSIFVPVLWCIVDGLRIESVKVNYTHPREQTEAEEGDMIFLLKRIEQLSVLVSTIKRFYDDIKTKS